MAEQYNPEVCDKLQQMFHSLALHRPMRVSRYEPGTELTCDLTGVETTAHARARLLIEKFVGGGFAGQVYKVKLLEIQSESTSSRPLTVGNTYAIKILLPPTGFARLFRNLLYRLGFQGPFQLQVNPVAARAGALWQKFIRRAAKIQFGSEQAVVDIHATFVDETIGSCAELSEWIEGRTWRLEVDNHLDLLKLWRRRKPIDEQKLGSPEYRVKKKFMADFVNLLHDIGAHEFARQYEWSTCKPCPEIDGDQARCRVGVGGFSFEDIGLALAGGPFVLAGELVGADVVEEVYEVGHNHSRLARPVRQRRPRKTRQLHRLTQRPLRRYDSHARRAQKRRKNLPKLHPRHHPQPHPTALQPHALVNDALLRRHRLANAKPHRR